MQTYGTVPPRIGKTLPGKMGTPSVKPTPKPKVKAAPAARGIINTARARQLRYT